jgi:glycosyltransferase involved in cell wall biosynthesis
VNSGGLDMSDMKGEHSRTGRIGLYDIAVLIPCYNEALTIARVIESFRTALPTAVIYVYDNNSTDDTAAQAAAAGAVVRHEPRQGKGNVVRRMFADIDADFYVLVDGDGTYEASLASDLLQYCLRHQIDMLNAARRATGSQAYRPGHQLGNHLLNFVVRALFAREFADMLSGYRIFSRRFVKSFPVVAGGFEIETELTIHAIEMSMPVAEVSVPFRERPAGSVSKLNTFRDGLRILKLILRLLREERPLQFFGLMALALVAAAIILFVPILHEYHATGLVPRVPTFVLSTVCGMLSCLSFSVGLILSTVTRGRKEAKRLRYLSIEAPWSKNRDSANHAAQWTASRSCV